MIKRIGDLLRDYLKERGWSAEDPCSPIFGEWQKVVEEPLSEHSRPVEIQDGLLIVEVDHPGWVQTFLLKKKSLLASIQRAAPDAKVTDIRVRFAGKGGKGC